LHYRSDDVRCTSSSTGHGEPGKSVSQRHVRYNFTDLGTLGGTFSEAVGINNKGWIAGSSTTPSDQVIHAALWRNGKLLDLGTLGGPNSVAPEADPQPNARGEVAGNSDTITPDPNGEDFCGFGTHLICLPFVWNNGNMTALPTLGGNNGQTWQVSNNGEVAGTAETAAADPSCNVLELETEPVIWENGQPQQLPTVSGDLDGAAQDINDHEQAVGLTGNCVADFPNTIFHAVLWQRAGSTWTATQLPSLGGTVLNVAFSINDRGQIAGQTALPGNTGFHAVIWEDGGVKDLGTLPGDAVSRIETINNHSEAVGTSFDAAGNMHPFVWRNGTMTNLNAFLSPNSLWVILEALGNNDREQIVGFAMNNSTGEVHGYVLTPCGENESVSCDESTSTLSASVPPKPRAPMPVGLQRRMSRFHPLPFLLEQENLP
jgi:probable HAF family extracellular repeat protein